MLTNAKVEIEKFNGTNNFNTWQCKIMDALFQQELDITLEENKPLSMDNDEWNRINYNACVAIPSFFTKEHKFPYMGETSASKL